MSNPTAGIESSGSDRGGEGVPAIVERIRRCAERVSLGFDRWDDPHARGPGLYFLIERDSAASFTEGMGTNRWPVEDCANVFVPLDALVETAEGVAFGCDGAVIVHDDGTIEAGMKRVAQLDRVERERVDGLSYAGWMGARHMSALESSTRAEVLAAVTLSEEDGRVTVFTDGTFEDCPRESLTDA